MTSVGIGKFQIGHRNRNKNTLLLILKEGGAFVPREMRQHWWLSVLLVYVVVYIVVVCISVVSFIVVVIIGIVQDGDVE